MGSVGSESEGSEAEELNSGSSALFFPSPSSLSGSVSSSVDSSCSWSWACTRFRCSNSVSHHSSPLVGKIGVSSGVRKAGRDSPV